MIWGRIFVLLALILGPLGGLLPRALASTPGTAEDQARNNEWIATGVGANELAHYLSSRFCNSGASQFSSCVAGAQKAFQKMSDTLQILSPEMIKAEQLTVQKAIANFGDLQLVQVRGSSARDQDWMSFVMRQQGIAKGRADLLKKYSAHRTVDFDRLREQLLKSAGEYKMAEATVFRHFMNGMLSYNDPFSKLTPASTQNRHNTAGTRRNYSSGLTTAYVGGTWTVKKAEGPSSEAGIRQGDRIVSMNGLALKDMGIDTMSDTIKDPSQPITFGIERSKKHFDVRVVPRESADPVFSTAMIQRGPSKLLVMRIRTFADNNICSQFHEALQKNSFDGIILDVRGNGGGSLDQVLCMLGYVLGPSQPVINELKLTGQKKVTFTTPKNAVADKVLKGKSITVLQNAQSASGSEVLAGALRNVDRALVVGQRSYGKGSVSDSGTWATNGKFMITKTEGLFFFPDGKTPNKAGIQPDIQAGWRPQAPLVEEFSARNEDNQNNPTQALNGPIMPKTKRLSKVDKCVDQRWLKSEEHTLFGTAPGADYQLLVAEEVGRCSI